MHEALTKEQVLARQKANATNLVAVQVDSINQELVLGRTKCYVSVPLIMGIEVFQRIADEFKLKGWKTVIGNIHPVIIREERWETYMYFK